MTNHDHPCTNWAPIVGAAIAVLLVAHSASAADFTLRIQTHFAPETVSGKLAAQFVDDVETMSGGRLDIEMFHSSSVVKSVETFDAAATGILDGDMTGGAYQTGKNPAFQFVGDIMGGYATPWQQYAWLYFGDGFTAAALRESGVNLYAWSDEDRAAFRAAAQTAWQRWGDRTPEARALVDSHVSFMNQLGLIQ